MNKLPEEFLWVNKLKRYNKNPIIRPQGKLAADLVFNPAAVVWENRVGLLCRCVNFEDKGADGNWSVSSLVWAWSDDGVNFTLDEEPFLKPDENCVYKGGFEDPRLVWIEEEKLWVLTYTGVYNWDNTPGLIAYSSDLKNWEFAGETFPARAICITPKKVNGKYWAYYGNTSLFSAWSEDLRHWHTDNKEVISPREGKFDDVLCEAVASPLMSENGIFLLYNGAQKQTEKRTYSTGHEYSVGWVLLDANNPEKVLLRSETPFLKPELEHEFYGLVGYTIFANGLVEFRGKHYLYYGCNDTRIGVAIEED